MLASMIFSSFLLLFCVGPIVILQRAERRSSKARDELIKEQNDMLENQIKHIIALRERTEILSEINVELMMQIDDLRETEKRIN